MLVFRKYIGPFHELPNSANIPMLPSLRIAKEEYPAACEYKVFLFVHVRLVYLCLLALFFFSASQFVPLLVLIFTTTYILFSLTK